MLNALRRWRRVHRCRDDPDASVVWFEWTKLAWNVALCPRMKSDFEMRSPSDRSGGADRCSRTRRGRAADKLAGGGRHSTMRPNRQLAALGTSNHGLAEVAKRALVRRHRAQRCLFTLHTTSFRRGNNSQRNAAPLAALAGNPAQGRPRTVPRRRLIVTCLRPTDWRNGSASDSSPEGYAFESRIGH